MRRSVFTHRVHPCQQEFSDAAQNLGDGHLFAEQQVREVRALHVLLQVHLVVDLFHFFVHLLFSYGREARKKKQFVTHAAGVKGATHFARQMAVEARRVCAVDVGLCPSR